MSLTFFLIPVKILICEFLIINLHNFTKNTAKVFKKVSDILFVENIRKKKGYKKMYYNSVWPGAYSFKGEIKLFTQWFKEQFEIILNKINETEKKLAE